MEQIKTNPLTLVELVQQRAQEHPNKLAFNYLEDSGGEESRLTYQELDQYARRMGGWLQSMGVQNERALLLYPPGLDYIKSFFGCLYAKVVAVPAYPPRLNRPAPRLRGIVNNSQAKIALTTQKILESIEERFEHEPDLKRVRWLSTDEISAVGSEDWQPENIPADQLAFLQYTSGSTSDPKGVMLSHSNLIHNLEVIKQGFQIDSNITGVFWLPSYHDMGLIGGLLETLYVGGSTVLMSPVAFIQQPYRWLQAISKYQGEVSGAPNFAYQLCVDKITPEQRETLDLSSWQLAFSGAEPIRNGTLQAFKETFAPHGFSPQAFYPCYGLAEATLLVSGGNGPGNVNTLRLDNKALQKNQAVSVTGDNSASQLLVSSGRALLDQKIVIVDPESMEPLRDQQIGEIWVSGQSVAQGYWNDTESTEKIFHNFIKGDDQTRFLRTGDLGFLQDGELYITGRLKDLIIIRGKNHYPQDIELTAEEAHPAIAAEAGAAFSIEVDSQEKLVLVLEVKRSHRKADIDEVAEAIRRAVANHHEIQLHGLVLVKPISIAKTSSGKIKRFAAKAGYLEGTLKTIAEWHAPARRAVAATAQPEELKVSPARKSSEVKEIEAWLGAQIASTLLVDEKTIDIRVPFQDYGLDSIQAVGLAGQLETYLGRPVSPTLAWDYPNIETLAAHLVTESPLQTSLRVNPSPPDTSEAIAIVGIGCRFPGADNPDEFWTLLHDGVDVISEVPTSRWNIEDYFQEEPAPGKMVSRWGGFLDHVDRFDPGFFGISPREAARMDPQQRLLLEVAWEALENAGIPPSSLGGTSTGVYIGISSYEYSQFQFQDPSLIDAYAGTGNAHSIAANRLSYVLDLRGPSMAVDTACSSSLVSVHLACQGLRLGETDLALAGGVNLILSPELNITFSQARMLAPDGRCKTFDEAADGYVRGEGCGILVLKKFSDAQQDGDHIWGLIRGSAVNQDGRSNGLTAPNGPSQQAVIRQAIQNAGIVPSDIGYIETHGTGTPLGDPIEIKSLRAVFDEEKVREPKLKIGSVKTNIGHLESAAGVAGIIKTVLTLKNEEIPPHLHLKKLNPYISFEGASLEIAAQNQAWERSARPRIAGVSSFGFGGTNAHIILSEAPLSESKDAAPEAISQRPVHVLALSAKTEDALYQLAGRYQTILESAVEETLADVSYSANSGRDHFDHRLAVWSPTNSQAIAALSDFREQTASHRYQTNYIQDREPPIIAFLFTGQGSQYPGMGGQLYETNSLFKETMDRCDQILKPVLETPLLSFMFPDDLEDPRIHETANAQPVLFALEYALAKLWISWGVQPDYLIGHSLGEYVAACIAGAFSLEEGLHLVAERGRLMQSLPHQGGMAYVQAGSEQVRAAIAGYADQISLAAVNGPKNSVISGSQAALKSVLAKLEAEGMETKTLTVSHAFHSPLMDPILDEFEAAAGKIDYQPLQIPVVSNLRGEVLPAGTKLDAAYWREHVRQPVQFSQGMGALTAQDCAVFLEIGPKPTLLGMGRAEFPALEADWLPSLSPKAGDWEIMAESLGKLYTSGVEISWESFDQSYARKSQTLPNYPFAQERHWFEDGQPGQNKQPRSQSHNGLHPLLGEQIDSGKVFEAKLTLAHLQSLGWTSRNGNIQISAAELLELAAAASEQGGMGADFFPQEVSFKSPVRVLDQDNLTLQTRLTPLSQGDVYFEILSKTEKQSEWVMHASGKLTSPQFNGDAALTQAPSLDQKPPSLRSELLSLDAEDQMSRGIEFLQKEAAQILRMDAADLEPQRALNEWGLDSLMAIELKLRIEKRLGIDLPIVNLLAGPTLQQLTAQVLELLTAPEQEAYIPILAEEHARIKYPLSHGQLSMWLSHRLVPEGISFNPSGAAQITGKLDLDALRQSLGTVIQRHTSLRTTFHEIDGQPVQHIHPQIPLPFHEIDAASWSEAELKAHLEQDAYLPFDLESGPLLRLNIYHLGESQAVVLLAVHHIVSDFWSLTIMLQEILALYRAAAEGQTIDLPELPLKFTDYVAWEETVLAAKEGKLAKEFWMEELGGELPVLDLPNDMPRKSTQTFKGDKQLIGLGKPLTETLKKLGKDNGTTLYMTLMAAFQVLLHRYTGQEDILVASPLSGRDRPGLAGLVGYFVTPVGMRTDFSGSPTFLSILEQVREKALRAMTHQIYPPDLIAQQLGLSRAHLFQTMFILQQAQTDEIPGINAFAMGLEGARFELGEAVIESIKLDSLPAQFDLTMMVSEINGELVALLHYNADLYFPETIIKMLDQFKVLLHGITEKPNTPVNGVSLIAEAEQTRILVEWNETQAAFPAAATLPGLFTRQASDTPSAAAVIFGEEKISYRQLDQRSNQLARYLQKAGVQAGELVGIYMERSIEMVVSLLGILKAGAAYVPLDPSYPRDRITGMLEDSRVGYILTQAALASELVNPTGKIIALDTESKSIKKQSKNKVKGKLNAEDLMYVIYTSGSTGKPKGVKIQHRAVVNFLHSMQRQPGLTPEDRLLAVTTLSFDIAVLELFLPLSVGGTVILASREAASDGAMLAELIASSNATVMQATPSTWKMLLSAGWEGSQNLKILCGGESLSRDLADQLLDRSASLWNMYGPTETTIWSIIDKVEAGEGQVSIGRPIANTSVYLLDSSHNPVPIGMYGELYIGGDGVAQGYWNRPDLDNEKFIPNPFKEEENALIYRTGDLARYEADGNIDFLGRNDNQVKISGHRIEIGEIEATLRKHPAVSEVVVAARKSGAGDTYLAAYVVYKPDHSTNPVEDLRAFLLKHLPRYMLPAVFLPIEAVPLTPNGKVNRRALPDPAGERPDLKNEYIAPSSEQEKILAKLYQEILGVKQIGVNDDFFDLGGTSLMATRLIFQVREKLTVVLPLLLLFENPAIKDLSRAIDAARVAFEKDGKLTVGVMTKQALGEEALLEDTIGANGSVYTPKTTPENIFLTGATGFVGAYLVQGLIERTGAKIFCHVRAEDEDAGFIRLQQNLARYSIWKDAYRDKIVAVPGDLSLPELGISPNTFHMLAEQVDVIYHNGALVNFAYPYQALKAANVSGTREVLKLASRTKIKPVHFISSISIMFNGDLEAGHLFQEDLDLDDLEVPFGGYGQSKWIAEKMMLEAYKRGIPVTIFRPDNISGATQTGIWNADNMAHTLLKTALELGAVPDIEIELGVVPVDFVSDAICLISTQPDSFGKTFHLTSSNQISFSYLEEMALSLGYKLETVSFKDWKEKIYQLALAHPEEGYHAFFQLIEHIGADQLKIVKMPRMGLQNIREGLSNTDVKIPKIDLEMMALYIDHMHG